MLDTKRKRIAGWILSGLVAVFLGVVSAGGKLLEWEGKAEMFSHLGFTVDLMAKIGILEILVAVLYLLPWTELLGTVLVTGYLGGAVVTHLRVGDPFIFPAVLGVLAWLGLGLRRPELFDLARRRRGPEPAR